MIFEALQIKSIIILWDNTVLIIHEFWHLCLYRLLMNSHLVTDQNQTT